MGTDTALGTGERDENKNHFLSDELIEKIQKLKTTYSEYQNKAEAVEEGLKKKIENYMSGHGLWENAEAILELYYWLPMEYPRNYLHDAYWELVENHGGADIHQTDEKKFISSKMLKKVKRKGKAYTKHLKKARKAEGIIRHQVADYLNQHKLWNTPDAILEAIDYLPPSYLRFIMYGFYCRAKENIEKEGQGASEVGSLHQ